MTLLERLNRIPPKRCRAVARQNGHAISNESLAAICGFSKGRIVTISHMTKWDGLTLEDATKFAKACGLRLECLKTDFYHKIRRMKKVVKSLDGAQRKMYSDLLA